MKYALFFLLLTLMTSCQNNGANQQKISQLQTDLAKAKLEIAALQLSESPSLGHIVYLNLKSDLTEKEIKDLTAAIEKLNDISVVKNLEYGFFKNLEDARAMSDYEMVLQMNFDNETDYTTYQAHPTHLALKEVAKRFLEAAPLTYDYLVIR